MENTKLNFEGQTIYIGLDVHKKQWSVALITEGYWLKKFSMDPRVEDLTSYLKKHYPGAKYKSVYEAGYSGYWIHRELKAAGIENIVVNPADVPTRHKEKRRKTDKVDARKLCRELNNHTLDAIYVPTVEEESFRDLVRRRVQLVGNQTRVKNRIKAQLSLMGISSPSEMKHWSKRYIIFLKALKIEHEGKAITMQSLIEELMFLRSQILEITRNLRRIVSQDEKKNRVIRNLISIPGIGFITSVAMLAEIIKIERFGRFEQLSSYVGFVPDTDSSAEEDKDTGITVRKNRYLRSLLIEAAWIARRTDEALAMKFGKLRRRMEDKKAIVRIAKILLSRAVHVWRSNEEYVYAKVS